MNKCKLINKESIFQDLEIKDYCLFNMPIEKFLSQYNLKNSFDLIISSPPYNIGKSYEKKSSLDEYLNSQKNIIEKLVATLKPGGSFCWQVGNYIEKEEIVPLDIVLFPILKSLNLKLKNRIIWKFGHGLHNTKRFSGRYEVILWFVKPSYNSKSYTFNLDKVRLPSKYPGKKYFKGPKAGKISSNPLGKNPEDVWDIPNVKSNHIEKTIHPCQFPVGLIERIILALSNPYDTVFDPYCGVGSAGVASAIHKRYFFGVDSENKYIEIGQNRINEALNGNAKYRPHDKPIYDHSKSKLSIKP